MGGRPCAERTQEGREPVSIQSVYTVVHRQQGYYISVYISCEIQGLVVNWASVMATSADNQNLVNSLLAGIQARQEDDRKLLLTSFAMRMPIGTKRQLKKASKLRGISQTDIILELLDVALPALLGEQEDRQQELIAS